MIISMVVPITVIMISLFIFEHLMYVFKVMLDLVWSKDNEYYVG